MEFQNDPAARGEFDGPDPTRTQRAYETKPARPLMRKMVAAIGAAPALGFVKGQFRDGSQTLYAPQSLTAL